MDDTKIDFICYLKMSIEMVDKIKDNLEEADLLSAGWNLGALSTALMFKLDQLEGENQNGRKDQKDSEANEKTCL